MNDFQKFFKNIEIISNLLELEDYQSALQRLFYLKDSYSNKTFIEYLIALIEQQNIKTALNAIKEFLSKEKNSSIYLSIEYESFLRKKKELEKKKDDLSKVRFSLEKKINDFYRRYHFEIGDLIEKIFLKKIQILESEIQTNPSLNVELAKLKQEYESFKLEANSEPNSEKIELDEKEMRLLKKLFRKACMLCHPDYFQNDDKKERESIFIELKKAYDKNDLLAVSNILEYLEEHSSTQKQNEISKNENSLEKVIKEIKHLKIQIEKEKKEIEELRKTAAYKIISTYDNLDEFFVPKRKKLEEELNSLALK